MARYCGSCGAEVEEDAKVCGNCGVPLDVGAGTTPKVEFKIPNKVKNEDIKKIIIIAIVVVAIIILGAIVLKVVKNNTGYRAMLNKTFKAVQKADAEGFMNQLSVYIEDTYGDDDLLEDHIDAQLNKYLDNIEDEVGAEPKITYEVKKATRLSDRKLKQIKDALEDSDKDYDSDALKKAMNLDLQLKIKGPDDDMNDSVNDILIIKENGEWKILSFSTFDFYYSYGKM